MLDAIYSGGRGLKDQVVMKMLLAALEDYWNTYGVLPSVLRIVPDIPSDTLRRMADDRAQFEIKTDEASAARTPAAGAPVDAGKVSSLAAKLAPSAEQKAAHAKSQKRR